ncbi:Protein of unknown function (DUF2892) [Salsuginibacillus halophilus]|uniref:Inner membrane protein YgaP-like transmembrane domain-containing protein n=1 Tax=Salsuginibacillus halophilus TaxID=517424 RepID=A0A2P8HLE9_9BACI|nr:DUF2892 domain-containing protein [Salsuginibacillus halophilus]PSL47046.1 Protein of unknown function (DUF2892) [Salsuginibacillus halophilus]
MKPNIGIMNALMRTGCGVAMLALSSAGLVRHRWNLIHVLIAFLAGVKMASGFHRYCPLTAVFKQSKQNSASSPPVEDTTLSLEEI